MSRSMFFCFGADYFEGGVKWLQRMREFQLEKYLALYVSLIIKILSDNFEFFNKLYWSVFWPFACLDISSNPI